MSVEAASRLNAGLTLSGGTLSGTGDVTVSGTLNWTDGTMSGTGQTVVSAGGKLILTAASTKNLNRTLRNEGTANWTDGALGMVDGTFINDGSFTASPNTDLVSVGYGGVNAFNNVGTYTKLGSGRNLFATAITHVVFNNTGSVDVQAGTLELHSAGNFSGSTVMESGGALMLGNNSSGISNCMRRFHERGRTLTFVSGTHTFAAGTFDPRAR